MERTLIGLMFIARITAGATAQSATNVRATYNFYHPAQHNWDLNACLLVTNTATGAQVTGRAQGYLTVDYKFVNCGD
ncbi:hypothetical protein SLA2020_522970 [Shorea laevis]